MTRPPGKPAIPLLLAALFLLSPLAQGAVAVPGTPGFRESLNVELVANATASPDLADEIANLSDFEHVKVVVRYQAGTSPSVLAAAAGGTLVRDIAGFSLAVMDLQVKDLGTLVNLSGADYVVPNRKLTASGGTSSESHVRLTTGTSILANNGTSSMQLQGSGVTVAVVDSGIAEHPDFLDSKNKSRITARLNFAADTPGSNKDPYGHGTHVAGLIGGSGKTSLLALKRGEVASPYTGVAPLVNLVDLRVLGNDGTGTLEGLLAALEWTMTNAPAFKIRVVNLSLGTTPKETYEKDPLCRAVAKLVDRGLIVVVAAGNYGKDDDGNKVYGGILSPANSPQVITVGAANSFQTDIRSDDTVATYSSRGPTRSYREQDLNGDGTFTIEERDYDNLIKPDVLAPGNKLVSTASVGSTLLVEHPELAVAGSYMELSGTSMAAPVVSGIAALLLQARPDLTPALAKAVLMYSAQPISSLHPVEQGAGLVNAAAAGQLARGLVANPGLLLPGGNATPNLDIKSPLRVSVILGETIPWGRKVVFVNGWYFGGTMNRCQGIHWGDGVPGGQGILWSDGILYADGLLFGDGVLFGDGILFADGILWADAHFGPSDLDAEAGRLGGQGILFADGILWGDSTLLGDGILFGDGILWADGILAPDGILFGDGILWADGLLVGEGIFWGDGILFGDGILWSDGVLFGD